MTMRDDGRPWRVLTVAVSVQVMLAVMIAVYVASLMTRDDAGYHWMFDGVVANVALGLSVVLCLWRTVTMPHDRTAFAAFGLGGVFFTAGNVAYVAHVQYLDPTPFPNVADIGYLGIYPCLAKGQLRGYFRPRRIRCRALLVPRPLVKSGRYRCSNLH